jgi:O-antigen/teichoic acid export membrane protein
LKPQLQRLIAWRPGKLAKGTLAMTAGLGLRTLGQAAVFLIVARVLGVEAYGAYSAVLALAMTTGGFVSLGAAVIMLRETARDIDSFAESWGRTLAAWTVTAPMLFAIYLSLAWAILPGGTGWIIVVCLGAAEILFAPLTQATIQAYQGHERIGRAARIVLAPILPRLAAATMLPLVLILAPSMRLPIWTALYLLATAVATVYTLRLLQHDFGLRLAVHWRGLAQVLREGWPFAVGSAAQKVYVDIDKLMLARMTTLETTGAYSAAYRVVDMANVPLISFFAAAAPRFFRTGGDGARCAIRYAWRMLPLPLLYALAVSVGLYLMARLLPWVLGAGFAQAVEVLSWLAWLPLVNLVWSFLRFIAIGSNQQRMVLHVLISGAILNFSLNLWLIMSMGWRGAVIATYVTELAMIALLVFALKLADKKLDRTKIQ